MKKRYLKIPFKKGGINEYEILEIIEFRDNPPYGKRPICKIKGTTTFNYSKIRNYSQLTSYYNEIILKYEFNIEDNNIEI